MSKTLLLDVVLWDLVLDVNGNIAVAADPYAQAQDAASAIRLFQGEQWFDISQGVPYFTEILGKAPPLALVKSKFVAAALTVPGVTAAQVFISSFNGRVFTGQVQITNLSGQEATVAF